MRSIRSCLSILSGRLLLGLLLLLFLLLWVSNLRLGLVFLLLCLLVCLALLRTVLHFHGSGLLLDSDRLTGGLTRLRPGLGVILCGRTLVGLGTRLSCSGSTRSRASRSLLAKLGSISSGTLLDGRRRLLLRLLFSLGLLLGLDERLHGLKRAHQSLVEHSRVDTGETLRELQERVRGANKRRSNIHVLLHGSRLDGTILLLELLHATFLRHEKVNVQKFTKLGLKR